MDRFELQAHVRELLWAVMMLARQVQADNALNTQDLRGQMDRLRTALKAVDECLHAADQVPGRVTDTLASK